MPRVDPRQSYYWSRVLLRHQSSVQCNQFGSGCGGGATARNLVACWRGYGEGCRATHRTLYNLRRLPRDQRQLQFRQPPPPSYQCRNYIVLPSSLSELGQQIRDTLKFITGLQREAVRRTSRRIVLSLRKAEESRVTTQQSQGNTDNINGKLPRRHYYYSLAKRKWQSNSRALKQAVHIMLNRQRVALKKGIHDFGQIKAVFLTTRRQKWKGGRTRKFIKSTADAIRTQRTKLKQRYYDSSSSSSSVSAIDDDVTSGRSNRVLLVHKAKKFYHRARRTKHIRQSIHHMLIQPIQWKYKKLVLTLPDVLSTCRFDKNGYPLVSRDVITGRFINPWSVSSCAHEPFYKVVRWKLKRLFLKDIIPISYHDFLERTRPFISHSDVSTEENQDINIARPVADFTSWNASPTLTKSSINGGRICDKMTTSTRSPQLSTTQHSPHDDTVQLTWIGHATCLVRMHGCTILTDPVFSNVVGPMAPYVGHTRFIPPAYTIEEISTKFTKNGSGIIDAVLISHDHYDHLDYGTIYDLVKCHSLHVRKWFVPMGMKTWLMENFGKTSASSLLDIDNSPVGSFLQQNDIHELEWWESVSLTDVQNSVNSPPDSRCSSKLEGTRFGSKATMQITCAPAQHWCSRTPFDRNTRLWCSWAVHTSLGGSTEPTTTASQFSAEVMATNGQAQRLSFFFAGDTGIPTNKFPLHRQIGDRLGPFDLSAIPIGAYTPNFFLRDSHVDPEEATRLHDDLQSHKSVAIHWGTFPLSDEPFFEPPARLRTAMISSQSPRTGSAKVESENMAVERCESDDRSFIVVTHGDTVRSDRRMASLASSQNELPVDAARVAEGEENFSNKTIEANLRVA